MVDLDAVNVQQFGGVQFWIVALLKRRLVLFRLLSEETLKIVEKLDDVLLGSVA